MESYLFNKVFIISSNKIWVLESNIVIATIQSIPQHWEWDSKEYREAMNKKEVCQIRRVSLVLRP